MRIKIILIIVGCVMIGCASLSPRLGYEYKSPSLRLLDEYFDIVESGNSYLQTAQSLDIEVKRIVGRGDSLIGFFENAQKDNVSLYKVGIVPEIESYLNVADDVKSRIIQFQLEYRNYDSQWLHFMRRIAHSKNRDKMIRQISNIHLDIKDVLFESDHETLTSTQAVLIESFITLDYQIQSQAMQNQMDQWDSNNEWRENHE